MTTLDRTLTLPAQEGGPEDYLGEDGLLYCGKCHTPKEARFAGGKRLLGRDRYPIACECQQSARKQQEDSDREHKRLSRIQRLRSQGLPDPAMRDWTFANDNGRSPQMRHARRYAEQWEEMRKENIGLLFWGGVGTGKSFLAGCIANALIEREVPVLMTNFARVLNELNAFTGRNEVVDSMCSYPLLVLDDFGMERSTEFAMEQIYHVIDSRWRSRRPLIVTTNLPLQELQHPQDTAHARIYDRLLEMCVPVCCTGQSFRKEAAQEKLRRLKELFSL